MRQADTWILLCTLLASAAAGAEEQPLLAALELDLRPQGVATGAASVPASEGGLLGFELDLRCGAGLPAGTRGDVGLEALAAPPGLPPQAITLGCTPAPFTAEHSHLDHEIVVALWSTAHELRVLQLVNGAFLPRYLIDTPVAIESIDVGDADNDGLNEVVVQMAKTYPEAWKRQTRTYELIGQQWVREDIKGLNRRGLPRAERMIVDDVDGDGANEVVVTYWGTSGGAAQLYESNASGGWSTTLIDNALGQIDALSVGDYDHDGRPNVIVGTDGYSSQSQLRSYQYVGGAWTGPTTITDIVPNSLYRDAEVGDADNDGCSEVVAARGGAVVVHESPFGTPVASISFSATVDSAQLGDIDNDAIGSTVALQLGPFDAVTVPFPLRVDAPAGTAWDVAFRATAVVRAPGAPARRTSVESGPIRVEIGARR